MGRQVLSVSALIVPLLLAGGRGLAQPVLRIGRVTVTSDTANLEIPVLLTHTDDVQAYLLAIDFDSAVLQVTDVRVDGTAAASAEWTDKNIDNGPEPAGHLIFIAVMNAGSSPGNVIPEGTDQVIARIEAVLAPDLSPVESPVRLDSSFAPPETKNSYVSGVEEVRPDLVDGAVVVVRPAPSVSSITPALTVGGETLTVSGDNFFPDSAVTIDGVPTSFSLIGQGTIRVQAPLCVSGGVRTVQVCNGELCADDGYECRGAPAVTGIEPSSGYGDEDLIIRGSGFFDGTIVELDGEVIPSEFIDSTTVGIHVPACQESAVRTVSACNGILCDSGGFQCRVEAHFIRGDANRNGRLTIGDVVRVLRAVFGGPALTCPDAGDSNDDGHLGAEDALEILHFLFGRDIRPEDPFPDPGPDVRPDGLPPCEAP